MTRFDELRKAALEATRGPWFRRVQGIFSAWRKDAIASVWWDNKHDREDDANAEFIALANPAAILELLDLIDRRVAIISRYRSSSERMSHSFCQLIPGGADTRCGICRDVDGMEAV